MSIRDVLPTGRWPRAIGIAALVIAAIGLVALEAARTAPIRASVRAMTELIGAANRGDLEAARARCSRDYLRRGGPVLAEEGGLVGLPRSIDKNFRAWIEGDDVLICPTGGRGPAYRFVRGADGWRFDGMAVTPGRPATTAPRAGGESHEMMPMREFRN